MIHVYEISDLYGKKLRFTKETKFWYFNDITGDKVEFTRSAGTEYWCYSSANNYDTGKPILLLYPLGNTWDYTVNNVLYPGIGSKAISTVYNSSNLDYNVLRAQGVKDAKEKAEDQIALEESENTEWYTPIVKSAANFVKIAAIGWLAIKGTTMIIDYADKRKATKEKK